MSAPRPGSTPALVVLHRARARLSAPDSWVKFTSQSPDGRADLVRAVREQDNCSFGRDTQDAEKALRDSVGCLGKFYLTCLTDFNDDLSTTHFDIIQLIDNTILRLEAEGL